MAAFVFRHAAIVWDLCFSQEFEAWQVGVPLACEEKTTGARISYGLIHFCGVVQTLITATRYTRIVVRGTATASPAALETYVARYMISYDMYVRLTRT